MKIDLIGQKFNMWTVIKEAGRDKYGKVVLECVCDCGKKRIVHGGNLKNGMSKNCGCMRKKLFNNKKHGLRKHPLHTVWSAMKARCYNQNRECYKHYGGRGITICDEWKNDFKAFYDWAIANDWQKGLEIDRINNNGNYEPLNCRFVGRKEQVNNRRNSTLILYKNKTKTLTEWCEILKLNHHTIRSRIRYEWKIETAFETTVR